MKVVGAFLSEKSCLLLFLGHDPHQANEDRNEINEQLECATNSIEVALLSFGDDQLRVEHDVARENKQTSVKKEIVRGGCGEEDVEERNPRKRRNCSAKNRAEVEHRTTRGKDRCKRETRKHAASADKCFQWDRRINGHHIFNERTNRESLNEAKREKRAETKKRIALGVGRPEDGENETNHCDKRCDATNVVLEIEEDSAGAGKNGHRKEDIGVAEMKLDPWR